MILFDPKEHSPAKAQGMMSQVIAPRPIAMISTADQSGLPNVAPYSYFMAITGEPLLVAVSMGLREANPEGTNSQEKDTYLNTVARGDFVINVTTDRVRDKIETAAMEFPPHMSEFEAVGWTPIPSQRVTSPSLAESPVHMECRIHQVIELGNPGVPCSQVHLVIAEVVCIVLDESVCTEDYRVDQTKLTPIGRMGFPWFNRATENSMYELERVPFSESEYAENSSNTSLKSDK